MNNVFIVHGHNDGSYEEYNEWIVAVYASASQAKLHAEAANAFEKAFARNKQYDMSYEEKHKPNPFDEEAASESRPCSYKVSGWALQRVFKGNSEWC